MCLHTSTIWYKWRPYTTVQILTNFKGTVSGPEDKVDGLVSKPEAKVNGPVSRPKSKVKGPVSGPEPKVKGHVSCAIQLKQDL